MANLVSAKCYTKGEVGSTNNFGTTSHLRRIHSETTLKKPNQI